MSNSTNITLPILYLIGFRKRRNRDNDITRQLYVNEKEGLVIELKLYPIPFSPVFDKEGSDEQYTVLLEKIYSLKENGTDYSTVEKENRTYLTIEHFLRDIFGLTGHQLFDPSKLDK